MTPPSAVVDASVAIKWIVPEVGSDAAEALLDSYRLIAPQLIYAECANILWKLRRRGELSDAEVIGAATVVDDFVVRTVSMGELVPLAIDLSQKLDHAAYDCFYLALAILHECGMVTADASLHRKVHQLLPPDGATWCRMLSEFG